MMFLLRTSFAIKALVISCLSVSVAQNLMNNYSYLAYLACNIC